MKVSSCVICGTKILTSSTKPGRAKNYCSKDCKSQGFTRADLWTEEESTALSELTKLYPRCQVTDIYRELASENGWVKRSRGAIHYKLKSVTTHFEKLCDRKFFTAAEVAFCFGINVSRINCNWVEKGLNYDYQISPRASTFKRESIKKYAAKRPRDFYGISVSKLNFIFKDSFFSKEIFELAFADTYNRNFTIVRLQGGVYDSARDCAEKLNLGLATVEQGLNRESPIKHTHDLVRLNYPVYLTPDGYAQEFNQLAGNILIELYNQYKNISGYSKISIQIITVRQAVNIALVSMRSHFRDKSEGIEAKPVELITKYWQSVYIKVFTHHFHVNSFQSSRGRIYGIIKARCYGLFVSCYGDSASHYFDDFVNSFISKYSQTYFQDQYLPYSYPQNKFMSSDVWLFVECLAKAVIRKKKGLPLCRAIAINYVKANRPASNYNPDWIDHNIHTDDSDAHEEIKLIIEGLEFLNLEESYQALCTQYVEEFCKSGDAYKTRISLGISSDMEQQIIQTLKQSALPF